MPALLVRPERVTATTDKARRETPDGGLFIRDDVTLSQEIVNATP